MQEELFAGRYALNQMLGEGGMGAVYRAFDKELEVAVALKILHAGLLSNQKSLSRFKQEVRLARQITHRNVARTYDWGFFEGNHYITMEFVEGFSLDDLIAQQGKLSLSLWLDVALQVCRGLDAAHEEGIIHRDLKPDNVLITPKGRVLLSDFGISRLKGTPSGHTTQGVIVGTPAYMAPEQIESKKDIDQRADIYALGAMFFEMLTGECAWPGNSIMEVLVGRLVQPPPNPQKHVPTLPDAVASLTTKCLSMKREERYEDVGDLIEELEALELEELDVSPRLMHRRAPKQKTLTTPLQKLLLQPEVLQALHKDKSTTPSTKSPISSKKRAQTTKRIAILPLRNLSAAEHQEVISELSDDLVDALSSVSALKVRTLDHINSAQLGDADLTVLGKQLSVDLFLLGSVRLDTGGGMRMRLRLIDAKEGTQIWSKKLPVSEKEIDNACELISALVAKTLGTMEEGTKTSPGLADKFDTPPV